MPAYCSVADCMSNSKTSKNQGIQFHRLPKSAEHAKKWIKFCSKSVISINGFVCSRHFRDEDYDVIRIALTEDARPKRILKKNVVPTIRSNYDNFDEVQLIEIEVDEVEVEKELFPKSDPDEYQVEYLENEEEVLVEEEQPVPLETEPTPEVSAYLLRELNNAKNEIVLLRDRVSGLQSSLNDKDQKMAIILENIKDIRTEIKCKDCKNCTHSNIIVDPEDPGEELEYEVEYLEDQQSKYESNDLEDDYFEIEEVEDNSSVQDYIPPVIPSFSQLENPKIDDIARMIDEIEKRNEELINPKTKEKTKIWQKETIVVQDSQIQKITTPLVNAEAIKPRLILCPARDEDSDPFVEYKIEYRCGDCGKTFENANRFNKHKNIHPQPNGIQCPICPSVFQFLTHYQRHFKDVHIMDPKACKECSKVFKNKKRLNIHMRQHELVKRYQCTIEGCDKGFNSRTHLKNHLNVHTGNRPYSCNQCDKTFKQSYALTLHLRRHANIVYSCENCSQTFGSSSGRRRHARICDGRKSRGKYRDRNEKSYKPKIEYTFECFVPECQLKFSSKEVLRNHLNDGHQMEVTDLTCVHCYKLFVDPFYLLLHEKEHLVTYTCKLCKKDFRLKEKYEKHIERFHSEPDDKIRPFACDICAASFKKLEHIRTHIFYRHMNLRPFSCQECGKSFKFQCDLNSHKRKHEPNTFECRFCKFSATKSNGLRVHMQNIHGTEKIYQCQICLESFHYLEELKKHKLYCGEAGEIYEEIEMIDC